MRLDRAANRTMAMLPFRYTLSKVSCACQRSCNIGRNVSYQCADPDEAMKAASGSKLKEDMEASFSTRLFYLHQLASKGTIAASSFHSRSSKLMICLLAASKVAAALAASSGVHVSVVPVARITNHAGQPCSIALVMTGSSH